MKAMETHKVTMKIGKKNPLYDYVPEELREGSELPSFTFDPSEIPRCVLAGAPSQWFVEVSFEGGLDPQYSVYLVSARARSKPTADTLESYRKRHSLHIRIKKTLAANIVKAMETHKVTMKIGKKNPLYVVVYNGRRDMLGMRFAFGFFIPGDQTSLIRVVLPLKHGILCRVFFLQISRITVGVLM